MRVRELYTNYQLYVLFFLPRMRLRPTSEFSRLIRDYTIIPTVSLLTRGY